jgi:hypothetical protein
MQHNHGACSNCVDTFETFIGCKVAGVICLKPGSRTLVFDCGWGLTVNSNGAFWTENPDDIQYGKEALRKELARAGA